MNTDSPGSVMAELLATGSLLTQQQEKLKAGLSDLFAWIKKHVPRDMWIHLPDGCALYPSGEFDQQRGDVRIFEIHEGNLQQVIGNHPFIKLIEDGWLTRLLKMLKNRAGSQAKMLAALEDVLQKT
jgi:hypothetical protein